MMFSLARRIPEAVHSMKGGDWIKRRLVGIELNGRTLGVIGFGRIGSLLARKARALGMRVLVYDVIIDRLMKSIDEMGAEAVDLMELLELSDFVSLHVPLLPGTKHMIRAEEIQAMKDGAFLINTSRGGVVDEEALIDGLSSGKLAGAALDVYEVEPPENTSLTGLPNAVSFPHIGASTVEAQRATSRIVAEKLVKILG